MLNCNNDLIISFHVNGKDETENEKPPLHSVAIGGFSFLNTGHG